MEYKKIGDKWLLVTRYVVNNYGEIFDRLTNETYNFPDNIRKSYNHRISYVYDLNQDHAKYMTMVKQYVGS